MLKTLLAERFRLRVRKEVAERSIYLLVFARDDRKLGPHIRPSKYDCAAFLEGGGNPLADDAPRRENGQPLCPGGRLHGPMVSMFAGGVTVTEVASHLALLADREVINRTDLQGHFDVELHYIVEEGLLSRLTAPLPSSVGPNLLVAVQEQLGLKLESTRATVEVLVIESAELPTGN